MKRSLYCRRRFDHIIHRIGQHLSAIAGFQVDFKKDFMNFDVDMNYPEAYKAFYQEHIYFTSKPIELLRSIETGCSRFKLERVDDDPYYDYTVNIIRNMYGVGRDSPVYHYCTYTKEELFKRVSFDVSICFLVFPKNLDKMLRNRLRNEKLELNAAVNNNKSNEESIRTTRRL